MASPFVIGNLAGWEFSADAAVSGMTRFLASPSENSFAWAAQGEPLIMTTPALTGGFTPGDLIIIQWSSDLARDAKIECLALDGSTLAFVVEPLSDDGTPVTTTLGMHPSTHKVRVKLSEGVPGPYGVVTIAAMEVPGLVADGAAAAAIETLAGGIPLGWTVISVPSGEGGQAFTHVTGTDLGDGGGSIEVLSSSGGDGRLQIDVPVLNHTKLYTFRAKASPAGWSGALQCLAIKGDGSEESLVGLYSLPETGEWVSLGFKAVENMVSVHVFVASPPDSPIYLDAFDFPRAPEEAHASAELSAPSPKVLALGGCGASVSPPAPAVRISTGASTDITARAPTIHFTAHDSTGENAITARAPIPTLSFYTGAVIKAKAPSPKVSATATTTNWVKAAVKSPKPIVSATATVSGMASISARAPSPNIVGYGGAVARIKLAGKVTVNVNVTAGSVARVAAKGPTPTIAAYTGASASLQAPRPVVSSTVLRGSQINAAVRAPSPNLVGYGGAVCSVTLTGRPTVQATVTTGAVASIAVTCPLFQVTASATAQNYGSLHVIAPSPRMGTTMQAWVTAPMARLTAIGSATITATYEAYAVNLNHTPVRGVEPVDEVTRYTNFPFTHVVRYKNSYYGANSTGLYLLEGTTDDGEPIEFSVKTAMTDFDSPTKKNVSSAYFSGRFGPASSVQLHAGEQAPNTYSYSTPRDALAQNHRQVFGKGLKERYYALGLTGAGTLELDSIELDVKQLTRRI